MVKNIFVSDEDKKVSNIIAGITVVATLGLLYVFIKPSDLYGHIINIAIALIVGGVFYLIVEWIRKKGLRRL